ncbi:MAG: response regulator [Methanotrichaceae archaeon]|nr:response regulator [Methanotrichaceae archaeon]
MDESENREHPPILLVEDDEAHAEMICRIFEEDGPHWLVKRVCGLSEALNWLEDNRSNLPSLVIADYRLADGTGLDLAKDARTPVDIGYPLIILTGVGSEKLAVQTLKSGAMEYVVKDFDDLKNLPRTAHRVLREWDLISGKKRAEENLRKYIDNLEEANGNLEDFMDVISDDVATFLSLMAELDKTLHEKYSDRLDQDTLNCLHKAKGSAERMGALIDNLLEYLVPVYLDSSIIRLYGAKMHFLEERYRATQNDNC